MSALQERDMTQAEQREPRHSEPVAPNSASAGSASTASMGMARPRPASNTLVSGLTRALFNVFGASPSDLVKARSTEKSVAFFQRFTDDLKNVADALPRKQEVVMFIGDLERCPPEQVVPVREAINLLAESKRIYLVLALDPRLVGRAVEMQRKPMLDLMEKRGEPSADYGARFLEKIVSLPVQVAPVSAEEIEQTTAAVETEPSSSWLQPVREFLLHDSRALPAAWVAVSSARWSG